jgi:hypothetical protein
MPMQGTCPHHPGLAKRRCKTCLAEKVRSFRAANPEHMLTYGKARRAASRTKRRREDKAYRDANNTAVRIRRINRHARALGHAGASFSAAQADAIYEAQGGRCAVCGEAFALRTDANIDHCHATGRLRGWLCSRCNKGLGLFRDNPAVVRLAADYLESQFCGEWQPPPVVQRLDVPPPAGG